VYAAALAAFATAAALTLLDDDWTRTVLAGYLPRPLWSVVHHRWIWLAAALSMVALTRTGARPWVLRGARWLAAAAAAWATSGLVLAAHELAQPRRFHLLAIAICAAAFFFRKRWAVVPLVVCDLLFVVIAWRAHVADVKKAPAAFSSAPAYDVRIAGGALYFTDQEHLWQIAAPYSPAPSPPQMVELRTPGMPERMIAGDDALFVAVSAGGALRIGDGTRRAFQADEVLNAAWLSLDPARRRLFVLAEWSGLFAAFPLDGGAPAWLQVFDARWPWPSLYCDVAARRGYATSAFLDGSLAVIDLDTLQIIDRRPRQFFYVSAGDPDHHLLWAVRALPGELVAVDERTLEIRRRVPLRTGARGLAFDSHARQLFVSTYPFGDLFRVDADSGRVLEAGACGWRCRSLFFDEDRRTLWAASQEGIFRFRVDEPLEVR
jgi:hypothetical protein